VLHWQYDLKGAIAMTDPKDTDTTQTPADGELPDDGLEQVAGGGSSCSTSSPAIRCRVSLEVPTVEVGLH
jgi:hypothetical protein